MSFKESTNTASVGTAAKFGAADINLITKYLNGDTDVATVVIDSSTTIQNGKLHVATITNTGTITLPTDTTTLIGDDTSDVLTNKTLTSPTIDDPILSGSSDVLTLPAGPTTLIGTDTTDIITNKTFSGFTMTDATDIVLDTGTGTKIGTATGQKLAFYNAVPVTQRTGIADVDVSTVDGTYGADEQAVIESLRTKLNAVLQVLEDMGITEIA